MSCQNSKCGSNQVTNNCCGENYGNSFNFIIIIVLYILLAIILGAWIWN